MPIYREIPSAVFDSRRVLVADKVLVFIASAGRLRISLVGGLEHFFFLHILGIVIPTDYHQPVLISSPIDIPC